MKKKLTETEYQKITRRYYEQLKWKKWLAMGLGGFAILFQLKVWGDLYYFQLIHLFHVYREDDYFNKTTDASLIANKIYEAVNNNQSFTPDEIAIVYQIRQYMEENPYIDYGDLYQRLRTLKIEEVDYRYSNNHQSVVLADYNPMSNVITIYESGLKRKEEILPHELIHTTFRYMDHYPQLSEGLTELLAKEYVANGTLKDTYWTNAYCIKILGEFVDSKVILKSFCENNSQLLVDALKDQCGNEVQAQQFLDELESYCGTYHIENREERYQQFEVCILEFQKTCRNYSNAIDIYLAMIYQYQVQHKNVDIIFNDILAKYKDLPDQPFYFNQESNKTYHLTM